MHRTSAIALALLSTVVLGCEDTSPSALAGPAVQQVVEVDAGARGERPGSVTGSGHYTINDELRTFAFHAITNEDGTAKGTFELHNRFTGARLHGRVLCVTTFANYAWFGGVVENATVPEGEAIWRVKDNGEGEGAAPDQVSGMVITPNTPGTAARHCLIRGLMPLNNIESGNVQVRPTADLSGPFTGVWTGTRFTSDGRPCCAFRWDIEQTGNEISGLLFAPHTGCANIGGCPVSGIVTGNVLEFEIELSFLPGAIDRGTAILDGNIITGTVANCRFDSCAPAVPFRVTRQ